MVGRATLGSRAAHTTGRNHTALLTPLSGERSGHPRTTEEQLKRQLDRPPGRGEGPSHPGTTGMENAETLSQPSSAAQQDPTTGCTPAATPAHEPVTEGPSPTGQGEAPDHGRYLRLTTKTTCSYRFAFISIENLPQPGRETRRWVPPHRDTGGTAPSCCPGPGRVPTGGRGGRRLVVQQEASGSSHGSQ